MLQIFWKTFRVDKEIRVKARQKRTNFGFVSVAFHISAPGNLGQLISFEFVKRMDYYSDIWYFSGDWRFCQRLGVWRLVQVTAWKHLLSCSFAPRQTFPILSWPRSLWPIRGPHLQLLTNQRQVIIWSWKENFPLPHENFSQLFVITPPVFLSLFSKKYTDRGEQIGSKRLCSCQKVYESSSPGQAGPVILCIRVENLRCLMKLPSFSPPQESNYLISLSAKLKLLSLSPDAWPPPLLPCVQYVLHPPPPWPLG